MAVGLWLLLSSIATEPSYYRPVRNQFPYICANLTHFLIACNFIYELPVPNKNDVNSAITYYAHVGDIADVKARAALALFAHIVSEPAFNQLRTVEQLGYIVSSSNWGSTGSLGWRLVIQSEKNPVFLENRVDNFLDTTVKPLLEEMPIEEFEQKRKSLVQKKLEKFKNLGDETNSFWTHITSGYHDFMRRTSVPPFFCSPVLTSAVVRCC